MSLVSKHFEIWKKIKYKRCPPGSPSTFALSLYIFEPFLYTLTFHFYFSHSILTRRFVIPFGTHICFVFVSNSFIISLLLSTVCSTFKLKCFKKFAQIHKQNVDYMKSGSVSSYVIMCHLNASPQNINRKLYFIFFFTFLCVSLSLCSRTIQVLKIVRSPLK